MLRLPMQVPVEGVFCSQWDGPVHFILLPHGHREPEVALYGWQYHTPLPPHTPFPGGEGFCCFRSMGALSGHSGANRWCSGPARIQVCCVWDVGTRVGGQVPLTMSASTRETVVG